MAPATTASLDTIHQLVLARAKIAAKFITHSTPQVDQSWAHVFPFLQDQIRQADEVNQVPLPAIPDRFGVRLPPFEFQTTLPNLQWGAEEEPARDDNEPRRVSISPGPYCSMT